MDGLEKKRAVMSAIRELNQCPLIVQHAGEIQMYPAPMMDFQNRHPNVFATAYPGDSRPIMSPIDLHKHAYVVRQLPCRSSSALVGNGAPQRRGPPGRHGMQGDGVNLPRLRLLGGGSGFETMFLKRWS